MADLTHDTIIELIEDIFERRGADSYLGEAVTMSQHMLQGARLAEQSGADPELIGAALLHDIGHYTNEFPEDALTQGTDNLHEASGAAVLQAFFPPRLVDCVRHHVAAKRYLCATDKDYYASLSDASKHTLRLQGGPMSQQEADAFAELEHLDDILQVRRWDDQGKDPAVTTQPFAHYRPVLTRLAEEHYQTMRPFSDES